MDVSPVLGIKIFVSATTIACILDMLAVQTLKSTSPKFLSGNFANGNLRWASRFKAVRFVIGETTISFMKTRTVLFPIFEFLFGALVLTSFYVKGPTFTFLRGVIFLLLALPIALISAEDNPDGFTPNLVTYPGIALGFLTSLLPNASVIVWPTTLLETDKALNAFPIVFVQGFLSLLNSALGALFAGGALWIVRKFYYRLRRAEGMGLGAIKMAAMIGAFTNWQGALLAIVIASWLASMVAIAIAFVLRRSMMASIAFPPFLTFGGIVALFWGQVILSWYLTEVSSKWRT